MFSPNNRDVAKKVLFIIIENQQILDKLDQRINSWNGLYVVGLECHPSISTTQAHKSTSSFTYRSGPANSPGMVQNVSSVSILITKALIFLGCAISSS